MKKVFLINFSTPILREVALNLKERGVEIVYWQGYRDNFEYSRQDKKNFPNTVFHHVFDSRKDILPREISKDSLKPIGYDILDKTYEHNWQGFAMMNRSYYRDISFFEKRNFYYRYIKFWQGMLEKLKPDAILYSDTPHSGTGMALYAVAKAMNVRTLMLDEITIEGRVFLTEDYKKSSIKLLAEYKKNKEIECKLEELSEDLRDHYTRQVNPKVDSTPSYQKSAYVNKPIRFPSLKKIIKHTIKASIFRIGFEYFKMLFTKRGLGTIDDDITGLKLKLVVHKHNKRNKDLKKEYINYQASPDFSKKFIYIPLSLQPEKTTCPMGGIFDDQILMIEMVAGCLPKDWIIYVKEHTAQWKPGNFRSSIYRYEGYYKQIADMKNVQLVPTEMSSFDLINKSQAVATVTGTAGWEAILRLKPVLVFGYISYMYCAGALRVFDFNSCQKAIEKIKNGFKPSQQENINFLFALDKTSIKAHGYRYRYYKETNYISFEDNVKNLTEAFYKEIYA